MSILSDSDRKRVEDAVKVAESRTAGEIVTVLCERSSDYARWRAFLVAAATVVCATVLDRAWPYLLSAAPGIERVLPHDVSSWLIPFQVAVAAVFWWLSGRAAPLRRVLPAKVTTAAVAARAKQAFLDHGVTETRDRSGVLIFVSELEHRVQILADRGIHERVGVEGWQRHVRTITKSIREGKAGNGIVEVVEEIGEELASAFPRREDDENELPDAVVRVQR